MRVITAIKFTFALSAAILVTFVVVGAIESLKTVADALL